MVQVAKLGVLDLGPRAVDVVERRSDVLVVDVAELLVALVAIGERQLLWPLARRCPFALPAC